MLARILWPTVYLLQIHFSKTSASHLGQTQCSPFIMLCLWSIGMKLVISESCYKETILQRNNRKMTIQWSFSYNSFLKFHGKKNESHNMNGLYPNQYYNKVCYIGTPLYKTLVGGVDNFCLV